MPEVRHADNLLPSLTTEGSLRFPRAARLAVSITNDLDSLAPIERYLVSHGSSLERAELAKSEYLRFLLLVAASMAPVRPSPLADEFWHAHLLHSKRYAEWCKLHFGRFIHHQPDAPDDPGPMVLTEQLELEIQLFGRDRLSNAIGNASCLGHCGNGCSGHCGTHCGSDGGTSHCGATA